MKNATSVTGCHLQTLRDRFLFFLERHVQKLTIRGQRATGCYPFHPDRHPSFSVDLEKLVFYCFGCGVGGGVKRFAELVGEPWGSTHSESRAAKVRHRHRRALAAADQAFRAWERKKVIILTDEYRSLSTQRGVLATQLRLIDSLSVEEATQVVKALGGFYDRLATLEHQLDILTYCQHETARVRWWRQEEESGEPRNAS